MTLDESCCLRAPISPFMENDLYSVSLYMEDLSSRDGDDFVDEVLDASIDPRTHIKKAEGSGMSLNHIAGDAETGEFLWLLICQFH